MDIIFLHRNFFAFVVKQAMTVFLPGHDFSFHAIEDDK